MPISDRRRRDLTSEEALELMKVRKALNDFLFSPIESLRLLPFSDMMEVFIELTSLITLMLRDPSLKSRSENNPDLIIGETQIFRPVVTVSVGELGAKAKLRQCPIPAGNESRSIKDKVDPVSGNVSDAIIFFEALAQLGALIKKSGLKEFNLNSFLKVMGYPLEQSGEPGSLAPSPTVRKLRKRLNQISYQLRKSPGKVKIVSKSRTKFRSRL